MLICCPACDKKYMIDDSSVRNTGRKVRCGACGQVWFHEAEVEDTRNLDPKESGIREKSRFTNNGLEGIPFEEEDVSPKKGLYAWIKRYYIDWLIIIVTLALIIGITYYERGSLFESPKQQEVPKSRDPYYAPRQMSASPTTTSGITITSVRYALDTKSTPQQILVTGELINNTERTINLPLLRVTVHAEERKDGLIRANGSQSVNAYTWKHQPQTRQLVPGERQMFRTVMASPGWTRVHKLYVGFDK